MRWGRRSPLAFAIVTFGRADQAVLRLAARGRSPSAAAAARAISALAEPRFVVFPLAATAAVAMRRAGWQAACAPCLTVASGAAVRRLLSRVIARPRPPAAIWLTEPEGFSLPSRHTTLAALTVGACASSAGAGGLARRAAPLLAVAVVGASRVYLGVHWPSDVLAAWVFAEGWLHLAESVTPRAAGWPAWCARGLSGGAGSPPARWPRRTRPGRPVTR